MYNDNDCFWVYEYDPKDHTVYLDYDGEVESIGIRSIYVNENGEDIYSEMGYWGEVSGVDVLTDKTPVSVKWFDLQGREISGRVEGIAVKVTSLADGTTIRKKVMVR